MLVFANNQNLFIKIMSVNGDLLITLSTKNHIVLFTSVAEHVLVIFLLIRQKGLQWSNKVRPFKKQRVRERMTVVSVD